MQCCMRPFAVPLACGVVTAAFLLPQVSVTAACTCAAVWLTRCDLVEQTFTVATVGVVTLAAYTLSCAFLTMHEQVSMPRMHV